MPKQAKPKIDPALAAAMQTRENIRAELSARLKTWLAVNHLTRPEGARILAQALGARLPVSTLDNWLQERCNPNGVTVAALRKIISVPLKA